jgi:hypothetical protein
MEECGLQDGDWEDKTLSDIGCRKTYVREQLHACNNLQPHIKSLHYVIKMLKPTLKEYHLSHSIYSVEEFTLTKNSN